jgi:hypothetical protein
MHHILENSSVVVFFCFVENLSVAFLHHKRKLSQETILSIPTQNGRAVTVVFLCGKRAKGCKGPRITKGTE